MTKLVRSSGPLADIFLPHFIAIVTVPEMVHHKYFTKGVKR